MSVVQPPTLLSLSIGAALTLLDLWFHLRARERPWSHLRLIRSDAQIRNPDPTRMMKQGRAIGPGSWNPDPPAAA